METGNYGRVPPFEKGETGKIKVYTPRRSDFRVSIGTVPKVCNWELVRGAKLLFLGTTECWGKFGRAEEVLGMK